MKTRGKSAGFRREVMLRELNLYPHHYNMAFACSLILHPLTGQRSLRFVFPVGCSRGQTTGLPRSAGGTNRWFRSRLFAGGAPSASEEFGASDPDHLPFWPKPHSEATVRWYDYRRASAASLAIFRDDV